MLKFPKNINEKGIAAPVLLVIVAVGLLGYLLVSSVGPFRNSLFSTLNPKPESQAAVSGFYESFSGQPSSPARFWNDSSLSANWDVVANQSDSGATGSTENGDFSNPHAHHGADCSPPIDANNRLVTHPINNIHDAVYICKDHMMTSLLAGYALVYLTPNHMVDLSQGESKIRFDMTTYSTTGRDWVDLWITPFQENFVLPLERWNAPYNGEPKNSVHIRTDGDNDGTPHWEGEIYRNNTAIGMEGAGDFYGGFKTALERSGARENGVPVTVSPKRRDTFELKLTRTSAEMCLVSVNVVPPVPTSQCFFKASFADLGPSYSSALVQFGHHAYNPQKDCTTSGLNGNFLEVGCLANTWHWDEVSITPSIPFTIIKPVPGSPKFITRDMSVTLSSPTPQNSYLRFAAVAGVVEVSFDNGKTWTTVPRREQVRNSPEHFSNYWGAVPAGVTTIKFRGTKAIDWLDRFVVQHVAVYSTAQVISASVSPVATAVPTPWPTSAPIATPLATPVPTVKPVATPTPTPNPTTPPVTGSTTITFDDKSGQNTTLNGQYPSGVLSWGSNIWYLSGPWQKLTTKSISFNGGSRKSGSFSFVAPKLLTKLDIYNGGSGGSTVTLSCVGNTTKSVSVAANQLLAGVVTDWTKACTTVTISSTNGWDTNFDNLVIR